MSIQQEKASLRYDKNIDALMAAATEQAVYYLGFLYADGYIDTKGRSLSVAVHNRDAHLLMSLASFLHMPAEAIRSKKCRNNDQVILTINSKELVNYIGRFGIVKNKTWEGVPYTFPESRDLRMAFLHGWIDGDGYIKRQCLIAMANKQQAETFKEAVQSLGGNCTIGKHGKDNKYYRVLFGYKGNEAWTTEMFNQHIDCLHRKSEAFYTHFQRNTTNRTTDKKPLG